MDWRGECIVPLCKGRVTNVNAATQVVLVLPSVVGTLYGRVLIKRVIRAQTDWKIGEGQCVLRLGRGCMDQLFAVTRKAGV